MEPLTAAGLEEEGFQGFVPFKHLYLAGVPDDGGVYVVLAPLTGPPSFLDQSLAGRFKGKDPTVAAAILEERWVTDSAVIYIGKATRLRKRLQQYQQFGQGRPVGHWGGRYIWQIEQAGEPRRRMDDHTCKGPARGRGSAAGSLPCPARLPALRQPEQVGRSCAARSGLCRALIGWTR